MFYIIFGTPQYVDVRRGKMSILGGEEANYLVESIREFVFLKTAAGRRISKFAILVNKKVRFLKASLW